MSTNISLPFVSVKNISQGKEVLRRYSHVHVLGTAPQAARQARCVLEMHRIKEYVQVYRSLYSLHMGLGTPLERLRHLAEEGILPPLLLDCLLRSSSVFPTTIVHQCLYAPRWQLLQSFLQLLKSEIRVLTSDGVAWRLVRHNTETYANITGEEAPPTNEIPLSLHIPLFYNTRHVLSLRTRNNGIAMGMIELSEQNTIEQIFFSYFLDDTTYTLTRNDTRSLLGMPHPVDDIDGMNQFWLRARLSFGTLTDPHMAHVIESLARLFNPNLF